LNNSRQTQKSSTPFHSPAHNGRRTRTSRLGGKRGGRR